MAQTFKETAHLKTDLDKYGENYDRIFGKKESVKIEEKEIVEDKVELDIKALAREYWLDYSDEQGLEGFPESSSFICGFLKGYEVAKRVK